MDRCIDFERALLEKGQGNKSVENSYQTGTQNSRSRGHVPDGEKA